MALLRSQRCWPPADVWPLGLPVTADVVIDGMVGVGAHGGLRGRAADFAALIPSLGATLVVAVDVPSGVSAETGSVGQAARSGPISP